MIFEGNAGYVKEGMSVHVWWGRGRFTKIVFSIG